MYQNSLIAIVKDEACVIPKWLVQNFITGLCLVSKLLCYSTYLATYIAFINIRTPPDENLGNPGVALNFLCWKSSVWGSKLANLLGVEFHSGMKNLVWRNV